MNYNGFSVTIDADGATYTCPTCQEPMRYGNNADVDVLNSELDSHRCAPRPGVKIREQARGMIAAFRAKRRSKGILSQAEIDARPSDWYRRSETTNGKMAKLMEGR
jgi:hypothetical protein